MISIDQHNIEIHKNRESWNRKPLLIKIYDGFYQEIIKFLRKDIEGETVEIGSGMGNFKKAYPQSISTDIFPNSWIDRVESAYDLTFNNSSVSNVVLFDVFHHLAFPGSALEEFHRVLKKGGRVILFEPYISLWGLVVYGLLHHEPVGLFQSIQWYKEEPNGVDPAYYAAEGNTTRIFSKNSKFMKYIHEGWDIKHLSKLSAMSYILSGGFSKPAFYPEKFLPIMKKIDKILDLFPRLFATRMIIVLEKKGL